MVRPDRESGVIKVPGEPLATIEEFVPEGGTYEEEGVIYAGIVGPVLFDIKNKTVSVRPAGRAPEFPRKGATITGLVTAVQDRQAFVSLLKIGDRKLNTPFTAVLPISSSSPNFERRMDDVCKAGDYIKAEVLEVAPHAITLTMREEGLGVVQAYCSKCGAPLNLLRQRKLKCPACGNVEGRRVAKVYGLNNGGGDSR